MGNIVTSTMPLSLTRRAALREVSLVARQRAYPDCSQQPRLALAGSRRSKASLSGVADRKPNLSTQATSESENLRHPRSVQALHLKPLKREAEHGIPSCDFALRAAYYLGLPAYGPVPLPRITQRWTVPRSHFIFKKSQENFERITLRRLIQIKDGNPETVQLWLAYLRKHQYYGIGMKANMWEFSDLGGQSVIEKNLTQCETDINAAWPHLGQVKPIESALEADKVLNHRLSSEASGPR